MGALTAKRDPTGRALAIFAAAAAPADPLPMGNTTLISDLGGDATVLAFFDARQSSSITHASNVVSAWQDCRLGSYPTVSQATEARKPTWDGSAVMTFSDNPGANLVKTLATSADALWTLNGVARAVVLIGAIANASGGAKYAGGIQDGAFARYLLVRAEPTDGDIAGITTAGNHFPSVAGSTSTKRIVIVAKNASTGTSIEIPNDTKVSGTGSATGAGDNLFALGGQSASGIGCYLKLNAALVLAFEPSAGQVTTLKTYAVAQHGVTLV